MTDSSYSDITFVCDRSGSMRSPADPPYTKAQRSTDGVRDMVEEQGRQPGKVRFSLIDFDDQYSWHAKAAETLDWTCQPRGWTALLDAVGKAITETGERLAAMPEDERPGRVFFVIATDGQENASKEYTKTQVKDMITTQTEQFGWDFVFIGAGIDAFAEAGGLGVHMNSTLQANDRSFATSYASTTSAVSRARAGGQSVSYSTEERNAVEEAGKAGAAIVPTESGPYRSTGPA